MVFVRRPSKKWQPFKILKKITFSGMLFGKIKNIKALHLILPKNIGRGFAFLKLCNKTDHSL